MALKYGERRTLLEATRAIKARSFERINRFYGPDGETPLFYHNADHTRDVHNSAKKIGKLALERGKISEREALLIRIGALGHDAVHGYEEHGKNELLSAELTADWMSDFSVFTAEDRDRVASAIKATTYETVNGHFSQTAGDDFVEQAVCDADLASLGKPLLEFIPPAFRYYTEITGQRPSNSGAFMNYLFTEIAFLKDHEFYTPEARELYPHSITNAQAVQNLLLPTYAVQS